MLTRRVFLVFLGLLPAILIAEDSAPKPLHIHILSASAEYKSEELLKAFVQRLEKTYRVKVTASWGKDKGADLPELDGLKDADLLIVFTRRITLPADQLAIVRKHYEGGKAVIGLRTASHAFDNDTNATWDQQVLGGDYKGHEADNPITITIPATAKDHPVLMGVGAFESGRLYNQGTLARTATVLQTGEDQKSKATSPVTWVNEYGEKKGRSFYTSLAIPGTFESEPFQRMLINAVFWTTKQDEGKFRKESASDKPQQSGEWRSLFNGKDLTGWKAIGSAVWKVEDGVIIGGQDGDPKKAGLLTTVEQFKDFELSLDFMIDEHGKYNSGVYLRNTPGNGGRTGYQVNIGRGAAEEYCGGIFTTEWLAKGDEKDAIRKVKEWNSMRILAKGGHITVDLNGRNVADFNDPKPDTKLLQKGVLGLQTYGAEGHAGWVKFREIRIRELE
jgi:type 1 glutamine amidotransferase